MSTPTLDRDFPETVAQSVSRIAGTDSPEEDSYFQYQESWGSLFVNLCIASRQRMVDRFTETFKPDHETTVLDVGVTSHDRDDSNFFEKWYPYKEKLACVGLDSPESIRALFPDLSYQQIAPGPLPFDRDTFDIGVSSAVVEHVGNRESQREHVTEMLRVCKKVFITTPNRWFPVEPHTMVPFLHYLPMSAWHGALRVIGRGFYASEETLNPLSKREFLSLFPKDIDVEIESLGPAGLSTNLIALAVRK